MGVTWLSIYPIIDTKIPKKRTNQDFKGGKREEKEPHSTVKHNSPCSFTVLIVTRQSTSSQTVNEPTRETSVSRFTIWLVSLSLCESTPVCAGVAPEASCLAFFSPKHRHTQISLISLCLLQSYLETQRTGENSITAFSSVLSCKNNPKQKIATTCPAHTHPPHHPALPK